MDERRSPRSRHVGRDLCWRAADDADPDERHEGRKRHDDDGRAPQRGPGRAANLDDGDIWPVAYALKKWSAAVEKKVTELVKAAIS